MNKSRYLIVYHANCLDGFTACWAINKHLTANLNVPKNCIEYFEGDYTEENTRQLIEKIKGASISNNEYDDVYIVDYSVPPSVLKELADFTFSTYFVMLDHHKSAFKQWCPDKEIDKNSKEKILGYGYEVHLDNSKSGAGLAWQLFLISSIGKEEVDARAARGEDFPGSWLVRYVQDYDLWKWRYGNDTAYINKILSDTEKTFSNWSSLHCKLNNDIDRQSLLHKGKLLHDQFMENVEAIASMAIPAVIGNSQGLFTLATREYSSAVGNKLAEKSGTFGSTIAFNKEEKRINFSLRSIGDYDVSILAESLGGGGHKNAAGFTMTEDEYIVALREGTLNFGKDILDNFKYKEE